MSTLFLFDIKFSSGTKGFTPISLIFQRGLRVESKCFYDQEHPVGA